MAEKEEQGFNQSELEDIMSEIESLEKDFLHEEVAPVALATSEVSEALDETATHIMNEASESCDESVALAIAPEEIPSKTKLQQSIDDEVESFMEAHQSISEDVTDAPAVEDCQQTFQQEEPSKVVSIAPMEAPYTPSPFVASAPSCPPTAGTKMDFCIEGDLNLSLGFSMNGQHIKLYVNGKDGFIIEMPHGMKFSIPVEQMKKAS